RRRLKDPGARLYCHHAWHEDYLARSRAPFTPIKDHVLLPYATALEEADARLSTVLTEGRLATIVAAIPDAWLTDSSPFSGPAAHRAAYLEWLVNRLRRGSPPGGSPPRAFVEAALHARPPVVCVLTTPCPATRLVRRVAPKRS